jgi:hypothetical protein
MYVVWSHVCALQLELLLPNVRVAFYVALLLRVVGLKQLLGSLRILMRSPAPWLVILTDGAPWYLR